MKRFLAVYTGTPEAMARWKSLPESERQKREAEGLAAWHRWVADNGPSIVEKDGPLGRTKRVTAAGIEDIRNNLALYTVVQAESQEAAARLFVGHPHFTIFPGDGVEVMEVLPVPADRAAPPPAAKTENPMIVAIVTFRLPKPWTVEEAAAVFQSTAPKYLGRPGLVRKHYYVTEDGARAGGVYFWKSRADAEACYTPEWKQMVTAKYGAAPEIVYAAVPVSVDNVKGAIETA
jgi:hypothetical protein